MSDVVPTLSQTTRKDGAPVFVLLLKSKTGPCSRKASHLRCGSFAPLRMTAYFLGWGAHGCGGAKPGFHLIVAYEACLLVDKLSSAKHEEIGDAADIVAGGELWMFVGVDFENDGLAGEVGGGAGDFRRSHAAGAAPVGPEIDEHGDACVLEDVVEEPGVGGDGLADRRQCVLAGASAACVG